METSYPIPLQSQAAYPANVRSVLTHQHATETTADTDQTLKIFTVPANHGIRVVAVELPEAFEDSSDAAFNDTKASIGDGDDTDRLLTAIQINKNGTEVVKKMGPASPGALTAATVTTADGSDAGTTQTLANALKAELNKVIADLASAHAGPYHIFAADTDINLTLESMAGKKLSDLDKGRLVIYLDLR